MRSVDTLLRQKPERLLSDGRPVFLAEETPQDAEEAHRGDAFKNFFKQWPRLYEIFYRVVGPSLFTGVTAQRFVKRCAPDACILHAGAGTKRLDRPCVSVDLLPLPGVDVVADLASLPFHDAVFDAVTCDQVLEHVPSPHRVADELQRVTRAGGLIHIATPFVFPWHPSPSDYTRWTQQGLLALFDACDPVEQGVTAGPFSAATALLAALAATVFSCGSRRAQEIFHYIFLLLFAPLKLADALFAWLPCADLCAANVYIIVRKRADIAASS